MDLGQPGRLGRRLLLRHAARAGDVPLRPRRRSSPSSGRTGKHPVNRDRVYDFYAKEAEYFRKQPTVPLLLPPFPGLDGGELRPLGQPEREDLGRRPLEPDRPRHAALRRLPRRGGDRPQGRLRPARRPRRAGRLLQPRDALLRGPLARRLRQVLADAPRLPRRPDHGRHAAAPARGQEARASRSSITASTGTASGSSSPTGSATWRCSTPPGSRTASSRAIVAPADEHPLADLTRGGPRAVAAGARRPAARSAQAGPTRSTRSSRRSRIRGRPCSSSATTTSCPTARRCSARCREMSGTSRGSTTTLDNVRWRRFASGLHQALGLVVADGSVYVLGRDQITRLHDLNGDGEADFYECVSNAYVTSPAGHDFICGLQRDADGQLLHGLGQAGAAADLAPTARRSRCWPPASATPTAWASRPTA